MVIALGVFAWRTTRNSGASGLVFWIWNLLGWGVLGLSLAFVFVLVPIPLAYFSWALGLTIREAAQRRTSAVHPRG
jgi:hypothetical protein